MSLTPMKAIRLKCLECSNESSKEVKLCPVTTCPLYDFRLGKNPNIKRTYTDEQREEMAKRLASAREAQNN